jgi:hypothetical protein
MYRRTGCKEAIVNCRARPRKFLIEVLGLLGKLLRFIVVSVEGEQIKQNSVLIVKTIGWY